MSVGHVIPCCVGARLTLCRLGLMRTYRVVVVNDACLPSSSSSRRDRVVVVHLPGRRRQRRVLTVVVVKSARPSYRRGVISGVPPVSVTSGRRAGLTLRGKKGAIASTCQRIARRLTMQIGRPGLRTVMENGSVAIAAGRPQRQCSDRRFTAGPFHHRGGIRLVLSPLSPPRQPDHWVISRYRRGQQHPVNP